jgi:hypothetical protein
MKIAMNENGIEYLLDTSIFRGLSEAVFSSIPRTTTLVASPYCFWELLRHLDEHEKFSGFKRRMMRFKNVWVLDRAWREFDITPEDPIGEHDLIDAALAALDASESLDEFYASAIRDSSGVLREIADCCRRLRDIFTHDEQRFLAYVHNISNAISESNGDYRTPEQQRRGVVALINGFIQTREQGGLVHLDRDEVISKTYLYHSYVFMLAVWHARESRKPSVNDYRDAEICKHLAPGGGLCLVTLDRKLLLGVQCSCESLAQGNVDLQPDQIVINYEQFQARVTTM